ncbi:hypothetical protein SAMN05192534_110118 [Alteribacillus persepolensis]|uniref:Pilus assembly protein Flp/PilA n=1 Tax=Alteribacillus persepolensis TaxID=568899 RepID=A0A1G8EY70_9BACI|nr:hypothetical protein [Alteribacillus persepolensis]SDH74830.1 hypothetical protein SAMN05192534_110118 [Alteribacillus persepolensis]
MANMYGKAQQWFRKYLDNEKGSVSMEWIMLGLLGVALVGIVVTALGESDGSTIASAITEKIAEFINGIGSEG